MTPPPDVVVVGSGIAGLTASLALARQGQRVTLVGEQRPGAASRGSAGMLAPALGFAPHVELLATAARDQYPSFLAALAETTGIEVPLDRRGIIELGADDAPPRPHPTAEPLDARALASLDPLLAPRRWALLHRDDGAVDAGVLLDALERAADRSPRIARLHGAVAGVALGTDSAGVALGDGAVQVAPRVVLAAGAWAARLSGLPRPLPVRPVHGQLLLLASAAPNHVVYGPDGYLVPRGGGVLVGATSAESGYAPDVTDEGRVALREAARRMAPALGDASVRLQWAGLRPVTPDGLPILGLDPDAPTVAYACGYSRNGILFAPWAADLLAREVAGERQDALDPFRVERFDSAPRDGPPGAGTAGRD